MGTNIKYAPVVLFAYKRVDKLQLCIEALEKNSLVEETDLFIYSDGTKGENDFKGVQEVRKFLSYYTQRSRFKTVLIYEAKKNKGLANSIIEGVTKVINEYGRIIVVEDDLIVREDFLEYMNGALNYYEPYLEYGEISAYTYPIKELKYYEKDVYAIKKGECWGWGTWKDRWNKVDWKVSSYKNYLFNPIKRIRFEKNEHGLDSMLRKQMKGEIDSWAVRWCYHLYFNNLLTVYPKISRTINIGFDGSGTHCGNMKSIDELQRNIQKTCFEKVHFNSRFAKSVARYNAFKMSDFLKLINIICV